MIETHLTIAKAPMKSRGIQQGQTTYLRRLSNDYFDTPVTRFMRTKQQEEAALPPARLTRNQELLTQIRDTLLALRATTD